ncbi:MAG: transglutaminase domain-containing protein [Calditrichaeota bacterium]|nr:transglutaminase domain-containing protein [Calditrichota bacterium]
MKNSLSLAGLFILGLTLSNSVSAIERVELLWDFGPPKEKFEFIWNKPVEPYLVRLREAYRLDSLVSLAKTDLDRVQIICGWVHRQWEHSAANPPEKNDPLNILRKAAAGSRFSCLEYASVTAGCLNSLGIYARIVDLMPKDVEKRASGAVHVAVEAYLNEQHKWVMVDAQWNVVPMLKGYPLNCIELQTILSRKAPGLWLNGRGQEFIINYSEWIFPYLYFIGVLFDQRIHGTNLTRRKSGAIILCPIGSAKPKTFQGVMMSNRKYTNIISELYSAPERNF